MADDDDDEVFGGAFEDGHWIWDESTQALVFIRYGYLVPATSVASVEDWITSNLPMIAELSRKE